MGIHCSDSAVASHEPIIRDSTQKIHICGGAQGAGKWSPTPLKKVKNELSELRTLCGDLLVSSNPSLLSYPGLPSYHTRQKSENVPHASIKPIEVIERTQSYIEVDFRL